METIIEQQRRCHEERERLVDAMTQELLVKKTNLKEQINSDHRVHVLLDRYTEVTGNKIIVFFSLIVNSILILFLKSHMDQDVFYD